MAKAGMQVALLSTAAGRHHLRPLRLYPDLETVPRFLPTDAILLP
jgi:hypothetical protein